MASKFPDFSALCRNAASEFLQTAVFIDNDLNLKSSEALVAAEALEDPDDPIAIASEARLEAPKKAVDVNPTHQETLGAPYTIDVESIVDAFLEHGIICCTVRPEPSGNALKALQACLVADIVVVDWHLDASNANSTRSRDLIQEILRHDAGVSGRTRLICVYTAQKRLSAQAKLLYEDLRADPRVGEVHMRKNGPVTIEGKYSTVVFVNKFGAAGHQSGDPIKAPEELPEFLVEKFAEVMKGMLPATALGAIAAIRKTTHHILATFHAELDGAFNGHRLMIPNRDDAVGFILELLMEEIKSIIFRSDAINTYSGPEAYEHWIQARNELRGIDTPVTEIGALRQFLMRVGLFQPIVPQAYEDELYDSIKETHAGYGKSAFKRMLNCFPALFYSDENNTAKSLLSFSELSTLNHTRAAMFSGAETWAPVLTLGTVLMPKSAALAKSIGTKQSDILVCVQPRCDCLRLSPGEERIFPFLVGKEANQNGKANYVVEGRRYKVEASLKNLVLLKLKAAPQASGSVKTKRRGKDYVLRCGKYTLLWIAEIRPLLAQELSSNLSASAQRPGPEQFEWLRRQG